MCSSFYNADKRAHRKIMFVGLLSCAVFVAIAFFAREQPDNNYVLIKADKLVRTGHVAAAKQILWRSGEWHPLANAAI
jgi:hypothetical protein